MNSKRQTIWLVSMLSLMVVLSAYYLFTDDMQGAKQTAIDDSLNEVVLDTTVASGESAATDPTNAINGASTDQEILQYMQAHDDSGQDYFAEHQMNRMESQDRQMESLMEIINSGNDEAVAKAMAEMNELDDLRDKVEDVESRLTLDYADAFVAQDGNRWTVSVQSDDLDTNDAVHIADLVMQELGISPDQITIQMVP